MLRRIKNYFSLSEKGMKNILKASFYCFLKLLMHMAFVVLVFSFLEDLVAEHLQPEKHYILVYALLFIVSFLIFYRAYMLKFDATYKESKAMRINMVERLRQLPLSFFSTRDVAELSQTVMTDISYLEEAISHALPDAMAFLAFLLLISILFLSSHLTLALAVLAPIWIATALMFSIHKLEARLSKRLWDALYQNSNKVQDAFEMQQEIKSYSMRESVKEELFASFSTYEKQQFMGEMPVAALTFFIGTLPFLSPVLTAILGSRLYIEGQLSFLYFAGYMMAATTLSNNFQTLIGYLNMMFFFDENFKRIREIKTMPIQGGKDTTFDRYDIAFEDVSFQYTDHLVLDGVSFVAKQHEVTALVGPSGCGKSTILRLIARLYDYDTGRITMGGKDIKDVSIASLYQNLSVVFQDVNLFDNSILENVRVGRPDATDEEVIEAMRLAAVDDIYENLPEGYNTFVGENGAKLSGGERQRISIARAFLKDAPVIILDEIQSSLDILNELKIQESLNRLIENKTVIIISHRMKSIQNVDKIVVLGDGHLVAQGTHEALMKNCPLYQNLVQKSQYSEEYVY